MSERPGAFVGPVGGISAYLVVPNHILTPLFGKLVFVVCDTVTAWVLLRLLRGIEASSRWRTNSSLWWCGWFLFNPFTVSISTRGSHDTVVAALVLVFVLLFEQRRTALAGAV